MGKLIALAVAAGILLAVVPGVQERLDDRNAYKRQLESIDLARRSFDLDQYQQRELAAAPAANLSAFILYLLTPAACILAFFGAVDFYAQRRRPLVRPDHNGIFPLSRAQIVDGEIVELVREAIIEYQRAQQLRAIHQPGQLPASLSYAPRIARAEGSAADTLVLPESMAAVPTFGELLGRGRVGRGNPLLLGFDAESGQELTGSWLDLYSTAVSGMPGSGKTTSQRFLACQTALHGARFAICDPHAGAAEDSLAATLQPLASAFVCEPAASDKAILEVVRYVADVGRRRVEGKDHDTTALILWVDELTALLGRSSVADELGALMERIAQEYRKRHVFLCASGQIWTAARTTSELRDSFASVLCHRMKRSQARLLLPTDEAEQVERLPTGRAVLWRTSGMTQIISIPNTTAQDCARVAGLLAATHRHTDMPKSSQREAWNMPNDMPTGSQRVAYEDLATSASGRATTASAEARRAAGLFLDGMDPAAIVFELRGIRSGEGKRYQVALAEVLNLIREGMRGA